jgi:hypothetical protein
VYGIDSVDLPQPQQTSRPQCHEGGSSNVHADSHTVKHECDFLSELLFRPSRSLKHERNILSGSISFTGHGGADRQVRNCTLIQAGAWFCDWRILHADCDSIIVYKVKRRQKRLKKHMYGWRAKRKELLLESLPQPVSWQPAFDEPQPKSPQLSRGKSPSVEEPSTSRDPPPDYEEHEHERDHELWYGPLLTRRRRYSCKPHT